MATIKNCFLLCCYVVLLLEILQLHSSYAATIDVGGSTGWTVGPNYTAWAENHTFHVGDTLFFAYVKNTHNVVKVDKSDYDKCNTEPKTPTFDDNSKGNTSVGLNETGEQYFVCTYPQHCILGMKVAVKVVSASGSHEPTLAPSPSNKGSKSPSSSPSTENSGTGAGASPSDASDGTVCGRITIKAVMLALVYVFMFT